MDLGCSIVFQQLDNELRCRSPDKGIVYRIGYVKGIEVGHNATEMIFTRFADAGTNKWRLGDGFLASVLFAVEHPKGIDLCWQPFFNEGNLGDLKDSRHVSNVTAILFNIVDFSSWKEGGSKNV